jgi:hypothetical protein
MQRIFVTSSVVIVVLSQFVLQAATFILQLASSANQVVSSAIVLLPVILPGLWRSVSCEHFQSTLVQFPFLPFTSSVLAVWIRIEAPLSWQGIFFGNFYRNEWRHACCSLTFSYNGRRSLFQYKFGGGGGDCCGSYVHEICVGHVPRGIFGACNRRDPAAYSLSLRSLNLATERSVSGCH